MIVRGEQTYDFDGRRVTVGEGEFLWISPKVSHVCLESADDVEKYAFYVHQRENSSMNTAVCSMPSYFVGEIPRSVMDNIGFICAENERKEAYHSLIVRNRAFECILTLMGRVSEAVGEEICSGEAGNERLILAKQYVEDNISRSISVGELASYCYISEKQLTRIFRREEGLSVAEYIRKRRCMRIEKLLADSDMTLREISEEMEFNNEYYFNAYFKKYAGMTPGAYRKTFLKK